MMKLLPPMASRSLARPLAIGIATALFLSACGSSAEEDSAPTDSETTAEDASTAEEAATDTDTDDASAATDADDASGEADDGDGDADGTGPSTGTVDVALFFDGALEGEPTVEDCTLGDGTETSCYSITVAGDPVSYETGPFCPETITDSADAGGLWLDGNAVYDVDGEFIASLAELYDDDNWQMYDEDGNVLVVESAEEFDLAARPDVDPSLQNHCVEGRVEWLADGEPIASTVLIPVEPVLADAPSATQGNLGVTLDGVVIAASAPVDAILSAYTIAAFDDCGGHYNPTDGYHLHGAVGCSELEEAADGDTPMFGYAMDGIPVHSPLDDPDAADLDECNGHETEAAGYHYHANSAEQNLVIACLVGETVAGGEGGGGGGRPDGPPPGGEEG